MPYGGGRDGSQRLIEKLGNDVGVPYSYSVVDLCATAGEQNRLPVGGDGSVWQPW